MSTVLKVASAAVTVTVQEALPYDEDSVMVQVP
jgi:hypothetical protein